MTEYNPELLFTDLHRAIAHHGTRNYEPQDPNLPAPHNGTLQQDGRPSYFIDFEQTSEQIPPAIRALDVDQIQLWYGTPTLLDGAWAPERIQVTAHYPEGFAKEYVLRKQLGTISGRLTIEIDEIDDIDDAEQPATHAIPPERQREIMNDMFAGRRHHMLGDGDEGEYARRIHLSMMGGVELGVDDYEFLALVADEYKPTAA